MESENPEEENDTVTGKLLPNHLVKILIFLSILGVLISIAITIAYFSIFNGELDTKQETWGQFGDYIGGTLNPLFAFLAFIALIITISIQSKELSLSIKELSETSKALKDQSDSLEKQNFENAFFQMLNFHNNILDGIEQTHGNKQLKGRECFSYFYSSLEYYFRDYSKKDRSIYRYKIDNDTYNKFYIEHQSTIGHYFRNLYNIIKHIDKSSIDDKKFYTNLVRAQFSVYEILLLFYNCEFGMGKEKFKPLIEKYSLFKTLDPEMLYIEDHYDRYEPKAFG